MRVHKTYVHTRGAKKLCPKMENELVKQRKGTRRCLHQDTNSFITLSLYTCLFLSRPQCRQFDVEMFFLCLMHSNKVLKQDKDVGMGL